MVISGWKFVVVTNHPQITVAFAVVFLLRKICTSLGWSLPPQTFVAINNIEKKKK